MFMCSCLVGVDVQVVVRVVLLVIVVLFHSTGRCTGAVSGCCGSSDRCVL